MKAERRIIFIHGLDGSSQGVKAGLLRGLFPGILTPDFHGSLEERMELLREVLGESRGWVIIGSSFGGLMAALFAGERPGQVDRLVLLAPALIWPDFASRPPIPINVPTIIYHGRRDELLPLQMVRVLAESAFANLEFRVVDDDHGLYQTVHAIDWVKILEEN